MAGQFDTDINPMSAPTSKGLQVLLVDDNPIQLALLRYLFQHAGHQITEAKNGAEALILISSAMPDIVVSDCQMPMLDGYQLCRLLKDDRATRHLPVILLTAQGGCLSRFWARTCGADRFLVKGREMNSVVAAAEHLAEVPRRPRLEGLVPKIAEDNFSIESIQRHLGRALEQRLLESAMRNAVSTLYTADHNSRSLAEGFLGVVQELILPGAVAMAYLEGDHVKAVGIHGPCAPASRRTELELRLQESLQLDAPPTIAWTEADGSEERGLQLRHPVVAGQPIGLRGHAHLGAVALLLEEETWEDQQRLFDIAFDELARVMGLERSHALLYQQAIRDPLTGLYNRRHMIELLDHEVEQARRYGLPLSVLALDLDRFKHINDAYGHPAGDQVLGVAAQRMSFALRKVDRLARMGGEEFLVLCPRTDLEGARLLAERIRAGMEAEEVPGLPEQKVVTVSVGIAVLDGEGDEVPTLLARADARLYEAKERGRNQVVS
ncbi:MAG: diguanylate cyclase [Acidobacteria bacterium]|nr:diguanylate cyclase [Acidobacteriota bacterium]